MNVAAIIPAAGAGKRLKASTAKPFVKVFGKPLLVYTLENLKQTFDFSEIIVAADPSRIKAIEALIARYDLKGVRTVPGGSTRARSVYNALKDVSAGSRWVLIHDAARPLVTAPVIKRLLKEVRRSEAVICAVPVTATVKKSDVRGKFIQNTEDRSRLFLAQTPQVFAKVLLADRYKVLGFKAWAATDEAALFDGSQTRVRLVEGDSGNIKITVPGDLELFKYYLRNCKKW